MTMTKNQIVYVADDEAMQILDSVPLAKRDGFINEAIKAAKSKLHQSPAAPKASGGQDPISLELQRIFGDEAGAIAATPQDANGHVKLLNTKSNQTIACVSQEIMDVLKSLRPPITLEEVWDLVCAFKI